MKYIGAITIDPFTIDPITSGTRHILQCRLLLLSGSHQGPPHGQRAEAPKKSAAPNRGKATTDRDSGFGRGMFFLVPS